MPYIIGRGLQPPCLSPGFNSNDALFYPTSLPRLKQVLRCFSYLVRNRTICGHSRGDDLFTRSSPIHVRRQHNRLTALLSRQQGIKPVGSTRSVQLKKQRHRPPATLVQGRPQSISFMFLVSGNLAGQQVTRFPAGLELQVTPANASTDVVPSDNHPAARLARCRATKPTQSHQHTGLPTKYPLKIVNPEHL